MTARARVSRLMAEMHEMGWLHKDDVEDFLRDIAAHGKRTHSVKAHQLLHLCGAVKPESVPKKGPV